jgi:hypothetical protein
VIGIGELHEQMSRSQRGRGGWQLVRGRVLEGVPRGVAELASEMGSGVVLARLDTESVAPWSRPLLERIDLGRDFWIGDGSGHALVRVGEGGHVHPDVELHLDAPFVELSADAERSEAGIDEEDDFRRTTYLRVLRTGDDVYVWGRPALRYVEDASYRATYRESPLTVEFSPFTVMHIYDAPAYQQADAWRALPWYRKLSLMLRNR